MLRDLKLEKSSNEFMEESNNTVATRENYQESLSKFEQEAVIDIDESNVPKATNHSYAKILKCISNNFKHPKHILLPTAIEATVALAFAAADTPFLTKNTNWYFHPFAISSGMILFNFFSRSIKLDESKTSNVNFNRKIRSLFFGIMDLMNRSVLTHEAGHLIGSFCVYQNPDPKITLTPPLDGLTTYNPLHPNGLGMMLGDEASRAVVSAAGVGTELLYNAAGLTAAQAISDNYPEIKAHLRFAMVLSVLRSAFYALSAAWDCETALQDFCYLKNIAGIPPIAAVCLIVGSMVLLQLCLSCACCKKIKNENQAMKIEEMPDNNLNEEIRETTKLLR